MKKLMIGTLVALACGLGACSNTSNSKATSQPAAKVTRQSKPATKQPAKQTAKMDLAQIQKGNYQSLKGQWTQIANATNFHNGTQTGYQAGGNAKMAVTASVLTAADVKLAGGKLVDANGEHPLSFKPTGQALTALLQDSAKVAINWAVTFYPKGSTSEFKSITGDATNQQNIVVVWTSNNDTSWVFAEGVLAAQLKAMQGLNLDALAQNDLSSLAGTWKNPTDGRTMTVTTKTTTAPASMNLSVATGVELTTKDSDGYAEVITSGPVTTGYIMGSIGTFNPNVMSSMAPLAIVPKGVQMSSADDSDASRDRLIPGGGQSGYQTDAYYKVD